MRLVAAEGMRAYDGAPLAPAVAEDDDHGGRQMPVRFGLVELERFVRIVFHLVRRMAQVVFALLLHPENEIGVVLRIRVAELLFDLGIGDDDELPRLRVRAGHRPARDLENLVDRVLGNRIGPELAHAHARLHEVEEHLIGRVFFAHSKSLRKSALDRTAAGAALNISMPRYAVKFRDRSTMTRGRSI